MNYENTLSTGSKPSLFKRQNNTLFCLFILPNACECNNMQENAMHQKSSRNARMLPDELLQSPLHLSPVPHDATGFLCHSRMGRLLHLFKQGAYLYLLILDVLDWSADSLRPGIEEEQTDLLFVETLASLTEQMECSAVRE